MNTALYSPTFAANLYALGQLQRFGGHYTTENNRLIISDSPSGATLDTPRLNSSNLLPVNPSNLLRSHLANPTKYLTSAPPGLTLLPRYSLLGEALRTPMPQLPQHNSDSAIIAPESAKLSPISAQPTHTREQLLRASKAHNLHCALHHPSDESLTSDLQTGKIPYTTVTPTDLRTHRELFGSCPQCLEGKATQPHRPPSQSAPATRTGQVLSFDPQPLSTPSLGGFTVINTLVDEHSKLVTMSGSTSKHSQPVFSAIMNTIRQRYNSHKHRVETLMADPEAINTSLQASLGANGIQIKFAYPSEHASRVERATRTINDHARATAAGLPYVLPPECQLLLGQSVCEALNNSVNKDTYPLTPNEKVAGFRPTQPTVEYGRSCMVLQFDDKRRTISGALGVPYKQVPKTEIGVSMGPVPGTDRTRFLLANGKIVVRRQIGPLFHRSYIPFGFKPKHSNITSLPLIEPAITTPATTDPDHNSNVQQPSNDNTVAVSIPQQISPSTLMHRPQTTPPSIPAPTQAPALPIPDTTPPLTLQLPQPPPPTLTIDIQPPLPPPTPHPTATHHRPAVSLGTTTPHPAILALPPSRDLTDNRALAHSPGPRSLPAPLTSAPPPTRQSSRTQPHVPGRYSTLHTHGRPQANVASALNLIRKHAAARNASKREREHMRLYPPPKHLNNKTTPILPSPPTRQQNEFSFKKAIMTLPPPKVIAAVDKEIHKLFTKYKPLKLIHKANIEKHAIYLRALLILREKTNKDVTARLAINGAGQPPSSYGKTHAGTSDPAHRIFILATALADSAIRDRPLITASFDIEGAFINGNPLPRNATGGHQLLARLPPDLPPPYGGALAEIVGAMYGLKQSNNIYDQDLIITLETAGYTPCPSHPYTFIKRCPANPADYLIVSFHVDDGELVCTSDHLFPEFKDIITKRYGITKFHTPSQGICGIRLTANPDKSITLDFGPYITKMMDRIGMHNVPPALSPSRAGLFTPATTIAERAPLRPQAAADFARINGELIFILSLRHDCRKEIVYLCRAPPNASNWAKQFHLLRYLKGTADLGPTFSGTKTDFPNGIEISAASDASQNCHPDTSRSQSAYTLTVGPPHACTAPFLSYTKAESSCIPLSPTEAEYATMSRTAKPMVHFRDFHTDLGFKPTAPSKLLADNQSAIKLVQAPLVPPKSRHIRLFMHHIRDKFKTGEIIPVHQGGNELVPDVMTKDTGPSRFLFFRDHLLGIRRTPTQLTTSAFLTRLLSTAPFLFK